jgi:hypothetical protein
VPLPNRWLFWLSVLWFKGGIFAGLVAGLADSTIGWWLSSLIGAFVPFEQPEYTFLLIIEVIAIVSIEATNLWADWRTLRFNNKQTHSIDQCLTSHCTEARNSGFLNKRRLLPLSLRVIRFRHVISTVRHHFRVNFLL